MNWWIWCKLIYPLVKENKSEFDFETALFEFEFVKSHKQSNGGISNNMYVLD